MVHKEWQEKQKKQQMMVILMTKSSNIQRRIARTVQRGRLNTSLRNHYLSKIVPNGTLSVSCGNMIIKTGLLRRGKRLVWCRDGWWKGVASDQVHIRALILTEEHLNSITFLNFPADQVLNGYIRWTLSAWQRTSSWHPQCFRMATGI